MKKNFTNYFERDFGFIDEVERIGKNLRYKSANKGEVVYAHKFKFIAVLRGEAKLVALDGAKELIFYFIHTGNYTFIDAYTALEFLENSDYLELSIHEIYSLIGENKIAVSVINALLRSLYIQRYMIKEIVFHKIEDRILEFMKNISDDDDTGDVIVKFPFNITTLSSIMGASRQNVSSALTRLEIENKIKKLSPYEYKILDVD